MELFARSANLNLQHVPYRGTPEAIGDTMNGRADLYFSPVTGALSLVREGKLVPLAVGGPKRSSELPDVPTTEEAGFKGSACERLTAEMEKAMGLVAGRSKKPEYYATDLAAQQKVRGGQ